MSTCLSRLLALAVIAGALAAPARADDKPKGEKYAFLVGCGQYDANELRPLKFAQADVTAFAGVLKECGWREDNIVLMHDGQERRFLPEAKKVRKELRLLLANAGADALVVVALSGHGLQLKEGAGGSFYFCPLDAQLDDKETLISLTEVYDLLAKCKAGRKLLLVDACRNDPLSEVGEKGLEKVKLESVTRPQAAAVPKGILALFSCDEGQKSFEDPALKHGVFFHHVLEGWQGEANPDGGPVTLDDLVRYVRKETPTYARVKLGAEQAPAFKGEVRGEWVLAAGPSPAEVQAAVAAVQKLGGRVDRDEKRPGRPVVGVTFMEAYEVVDADIARLRAFKHLRELTLFHSHLTGSGLKELGALNHLQDLGLLQSVVTEEVLKATAALGQLQSLDLSHSTKVTDEGLKELTGLKQLRRLGLNYTKVTGAGIKSLAGLERLEDLSLQGLAVTDADAPALARMQSLRSLNVGDTKVTDAGLKDLAGMPLLQQLDLLGDKVSRAGLRELAAAPQLETLNLDHANISDEDLEGLAGASTLRDLNLGRSRVTDAGLRSLIGLKGLRHLSFDETKVTDAGLKVLGGMPQLESLGLFNTPTTDKGFRELAGLPRLKELFLGGPGITDACLKEAAGMPPLEELSLSFCDKVTDDGLNELVHSKRIKKVWIFGCERITDEGVARLKKALPDLETKR